MDPTENCRCRHERKWHDPCSKCLCPYFMPTGADEGDVLIWKGRLAAAKAKAKATVRNG